MSITDIYDNPQNDVYNVQTHAAGPQGALPLTGDMLRKLPSGDIFGMTLDAGMGWKPDDVLGPNVLIISTLGGKRNDDGTPDALGLHVGHWELGLQISSAASEIKRQKGVPFASYVTDPCDGRTQGTTGMHMYHTQQLVAIGNHGEHIPAGDGGEVREAGETLEGAGELLVVVVFHG